MSLLKNLTTNDEIQDEKDVLGGGGVLDTDLYRMKIAIAYVTKSEGGAVGLVVHFKTESDRDVRQTLWMTNKKGENFFIDRQGAKQYLPGFLHANAIALLTVGKQISEIDTETKVVNVYSKEAKAEIPTKVEMLVELLGKEVIVGLLKQVVDKTTKGDDGQYHPTGETREENEIDKIFRASDKMTTAEIRAQAAEPAFYDSWASKNRGKVRDRTSKNKGTAGAPKAAGASPATTKKPTTSLFAQ